MPKKPDPVLLNPIENEIDALALIVTARHMAMRTDRRLGVQVDRKGRRAEIVY